MPKPTYERLVSELGVSLDMIETVISMLDAWAGADPEGLSPDEQRRLKDVERNRARVSKVWSKAVRGIAP